MSNSELSHQDLIEMRLWRDLDGSETFVCDITDKHLNGIISYLEKGANGWYYAEEWLSIMNKEYESRQNSIRDMF